MSEGRVLYVPSFVFDGTCTVPSHISCSFVPRQVVPVRTRKLKNKSKQSYCFVYSRLDLRGGLLDSKKVYMRTNLGKSTWSNLVRERLRTPKYFTVLVENVW